MARTKNPHDVTVAILTEAGYRCAVPTCGTILALDLHHIDEVYKGGGNDTSNLIALCPTCHALYHRGTIAGESIRVWKAALLSRSAPYNRDSFDMLRFLRALPGTTMHLTGDGVLRFATLVAEGLVSVSQVNGGGWDQNPRPIFYQVTVSARGSAVLEAWLRGDAKALALGLPHAAATILPAGLP